VRAIYAKEKDASGNWSNYSNVLAHDRRNGHLIWNDLSTTTTFFLSPFLFYIFH